MEERNAQEDHLKNVFHSNVMTMVKGGEKRYFLDMAEKILSEGDLKTLGGIESFQSAFLHVEDGETPRIEVNIINSSGHDLTVIMSSKIIQRIRLKSSGKVLLKGELVGAVFVQKLNEEKAIEAVEGLIDKSIEEEAQERSSPTIGFNQMMSKLGRNEMGDKE